MDNKKSGYEHLVDEIKRKHKSLTKRALRSCLAAVRLHCLECCGGSPLIVKDCGEKCCFLYLYRMGRGPVRRKRKSKNLETLKQ